MKRIVMVVGMTVLVLVIAAGVLLTQSATPPMAVRAQEPGENPKAEKILEIAVERNINGEVVSGEVQVGFEDPEVLPEEAESAFGVFLGMDGDVVTLGTGSIEVVVDVEVLNDEEPVRTVNISHSGDPVEIKMTSDTVIYADTTPTPEISDADLESGSKLITRTIRPGSFEAIEDGMILRVWGPVQDGVVTA
ncbi:hypothetical protein ACFLXI_09890, partial [Chloroflexota bacterium]